LSMNVERAEMRTENKRLLFSAEPLPDESFNGYLLRLTQRNDYDTLAWILQMANIGNEFRKMLTFLLPHTLDLSLLVQLTGVDEPKLSELLYHPIRVATNRMMGGDLLVFGSPVPLYVIRLRCPKVCPCCLKEKAYVRKIWDLAPVTACPLHKCLLLDECPSCKKRIIWNRRGVSICRCEFDWREYAPAQIEDSEVQISRRIYSLCNLPVSNTTNALMEENPLYRLGLQPFISSLLFVASQFGSFPIKNGCPAIDTQGKYFAPSKRNGEIHTLLCKALPVFEDWPNNYFAFLDWYRSQESARKSPNVGSRNFAGYKSALFVQLASDDFEFIRSAFREYRLITRYETRFASARRMRAQTKPVGEAVERIDNVNVETNVSSFAKDIEVLKASPRQSRSEILKLTETHVSGSKAKKVLEVNWQGLEGLIASGRLEALVGTKCERKFFLVEKASLEELKTKLERSLFLKHVKRLLGLPPARVKELIECGLLKPLRSPNVDGCADWRFDYEETNNLVERLVSGTSKRRGRNKDETLSFISVLRIMKRAGIGLGLFVQAMLDGEIKPCNKTTKNGLRGLLFSEKQITDYVQGEIRLLTGDALPLFEVSELLGISRTAVSFLVKAQILRAEKFGDAPSLECLIKREDLDLFNETYLLLRDVASEHGTFPAYLVDLLAARDIHSISGPKVDGGKVYVFLKSDFEGLDVAALISEERKKRSISKVPSYVLDEQQAADFLETDVYTVRLLVERGALKPHARLLNDGQKNDKYYFSINAVQKYKKNPVDRTDLMCFIKTVEMFALLPDNFINKYIKTGRLKPVLANGRRSDYFFRVKDVESLLEMEKQIITRSDAAEILGVYESSVNKMIEAGLLKPISGPSIDGYGRNLFLRSDVEKVYAEREAYRTRQIREGKSSRYGQQPGSKASPVQDVIGPRIEQLIEEWHKQIPDQCITGERLHQQLIREGYRVGRNTVYVYLRQKHRQAA
jgi:hypothetical protein